MMSLSSNACVGTVLLPLSLWPDWHALTTPVRVRVSFCSFAGRTVLEIMVSEYPTERLGAVVQGTGALCLCVCRVHSGLRWTTLWRYVWLEF